jgi:hypothetical protein
MAATPTPTPQNTFKIVPDSAEVNAESTCKFKVDPPTDVTWELDFGAGKVDANGVYQAPAELTTPRTVILTATAISGGQKATATITLADTSSSIKKIGNYAIAVAILIGIVLLPTWNYLYHCPPKPIVVINPPVVTLDPFADDKFSFTATVIGDPKNAVTWSVEPQSEGKIDSSGVFQRTLLTAPQNGKKPDVDNAVTIVAQSTIDPSRTSTAIIHLLAGKHLEIVPLQTSVSPAQQSSILYSDTPNTKPVPYRIAPNTTVFWSVSRSDLGSVTKDSGIFRAAVPDQTAVEQVNAWGPSNNEKSAHEQAAVAVIISAPYATGPCKSWVLLVFVIICGMLGSMIYFTSSFVAYVGNRTFRSSWNWFYVSRPFVGGALAVVFYFVVGSGMLGTLGDGSSTNVMAIGLISALVGLFSDKAVKKLSDLIDTLFATKDDRTDKVKKDGGSDSKPSSPPSPTPGPTITNTVPASISIAAAGNNDLPVVVTGTNLSNVKVSINGVDAAVTDSTNQSFKIVIPAAQLQTPVQIKITATTNQGSTDKTINVTA